MPGPFTTPVARSTPFDDFVANLTASYGSQVDNVQTAIEALKAYTETVARFCVASGFDGTASSGRWLEFITNNASNTTPFVLPRNAKLSEISISCAANATTTVTVFKNGVAWQTISLAAARKNSVTGLSLTANSLDEISIQVTSGSSSRPMVYLFFVFT